MIPPLTYLSHKPHLFTGASPPAPAPSEWRQACFPDRAGCSDRKAAPIVTSVPIRIFEFTY
ncbi:MAG: hypothetical protein ACI3Z7_02070, partial [Candidatus Aphodosoma sp.]